MKTHKQFPFVIILVLLVQACILGGTVTPVPVTESPAATATEPAATPLPAATETAVPQPSTETAPPAATDTAVPTIPAPTLPAPTPSGPDRPEAILIQQPGPGSQVTSPVRVAGMADPTFEQSLVVTILTADGTTLVTTSTQIGADVGQRGPFTVDVPFSVSQEQQGFIQVYAVSAKDGGVTHLSSVGVTLLPGGTASIQPVAEQPEQIILFQPEIGTTISGGVARVEGFGLASFEQTLLVEILDENGTVIASAPVTVAAPDLGQPGPFAVDIPYTVSVPNAGRIQVRDVSPAHGGSTHLASVEVRLEP